MTQFQTTHWSTVLQAGGDGSDARAALESLCRRYRLPVLAYLQRRGERDAEDMTQAFFERLITLKLYQRADRARGRFRTFLLTALDNFVHDQHGRAARLKRGGGTTTTSLDAVDDGTRHQADSDTPATDFDRQWALSVLDAALARLSAQCELRGKGKLFLTLKPYVIEPADHDAYQQLALKLGARPNTVAASVHRLRQRLRDHIRAELADTVQSEAEVDAELAALREALALAAVSHGAG